MKKSLRKLFEEKKATKQILEDTKYHAEKILGRKFEHFFFAV